MKVHLRKRELTKQGSGKPRYCLYLDIYHSKFKRMREFLGIYLDPKEDKTYRQEKLGLAENIKAKRQLELIMDNEPVASKYVQRSNEKGEVLFEDIPAEGYYLVIFARQLTKYTEKYIELIGGGYFETHEKIYT